MSCWNLNIFVVFHNSENKKIFSYSIFGWDEEYIILKIKLYLIRLNIFHRQLNLCLNIIAWRMNYLFAPFCLLFVRIRNRFLTRTRKKVMPLPLWPIIALQCTCINSPIVSRCYQTYPRFKYLGFWFIAIIQIVEKEWINF